MCWNLYLRYSKMVNLREIMSVGARLSTFVFRRHYQPGRAQRCRNIRSPAAQSRLCTSAEGLWSLLCACPSTNLSKYGSFSCKSMYMDIYRHQLQQWSSLSVNRSVVRILFFLQAQSCLRKPSGWFCIHLIECSATVFAWHGALSNDSSVIPLGRVLSQIRPSCIWNH